MLFTLTRVRVCVSLEFLEWYYSTNGWLFLLVVMILLVMALVGSPSTHSHTLYFTNTPEVSYSQCSVEWARERDLEVSCLRDVTKAFRKRKRERERENRGVGRGTAQQGMVGGVEGSELVLKLDSFMAPALSPCYCDYEESSSCHMAGWIERSIDVGFFHLLVESVERWWLSVRETLVKSQLWCLTVSHDTEF